MTGSVDTMGMSEGERRTFWLEAEMGFIYDKDRRCFINHEIERELGHALVLNAESLTQETFEEFQVAVHKTVRDARQARWSSDPPPEPKKKPKKAKPD